MAKESKNVSTKNGTWHKQSVMLILQMELLFSNPEKQLLLFDWKRFVVHRVMSCDSLFRICLFKKKKDVADFIDCM